MQGMNNLPHSGMVISDGARLKLIDHRTSARKKNSGMISIIHVFIHILY